MPVEPRGVVFDLYSTLLPGGDAERDRVAGEMALMVGVAPEALVRAYHDSWRQRLVEWDVERTVEVLAGRLGASPSAGQVARAAAHRRALAVRLLGRVRPDTVAVLDGLAARGVRLGLVSNATADTAEAWPGCVLASRFPVALFSCVVGMAKPDPRIYRLAARRLGLRPRACVFVGDGADGELAGAAAVGMTVVRTTQFADSDPSWSGATIGSLAALPGLLARGVCGPGGQPA